jgi:hypothetical protein
MPFVSVTRLRIRSFLYLPQFAWHALKSARQAERSSGFLGGRLLREAKNAFWTMTAWENDTAMNAFRTHGAHGAVMPKLLAWCDEASVVHWTQETPGLPSWQEAHQRLLKEGRPSKVNHPTAAHLAYQIPPPRPGRVERILRPATAS